MDLVINEEEATWVRELFYKVIQEGTSGYALAEMLNNRGLRTRAGAKFQSSNIIRIIRHEGYTGYIITKNARSEYIPELQIIDRETFDKANDIINRRKAKSEQERKIAHTSQNPTLLAGIVYCAHCGAKMSGFMHTDRYTNKNHFFLPPTFYFTVLLRATPLCYVTSFYINRLAVSN